MASRPPIIKQVSLLRLLPSLAVLAALMVFGNLVFPNYGLEIGAAIFLVTRLVLRNAARDHRRGMSLVRRNQFSAAIECFQHSLAFFDRHPWLDDYRSIILLSPSSISYREMALANIAFCFCQIGDGRNGRSHYQMCLDRFPESGLARAALKIMDSVAPSNGAGPPESLT